jgi:heterodisulfide reductase subunit B
MDRVPIAALPETARPLKTSKEIPADDLYLTTSCILGAINPATEVLITRIYDLLGLHWGLASTRPESQCTCCSGIATHGDVMAFESTLLVVARLWSLAAELGFENVTTACVTSFGIHSECLEMYHEEPGLEEKVDRWLFEACGRRLHIPKHVVHCSDIVYRYRDTLAERGADYCDVLTGLIRSWGGQTVDYPERRHCCGMGFRQCMIRPNRGYTMACVLKKLESMEPYQPDLILTNCPGCNVFLDKEQWAVQELTGKEYGIPTLSYTELTGLLLGWDPYDVVGIQGHTTPVEPLLDKIGIPYDSDRAWLAGTARGNGRVS